MWFDTPAYVLFLIIVVAAYWRLGRSKQNLLLLAASYIFYGWWDYRFLLLMGASTTIDFFVARSLDKSEKASSRRALLITSLIVNFGILGFFKYFNFFIESFGHVLTAARLPAYRPFLRIILPPGISFYTFQEVAYIVDVYKRKIAAAKSFVDYALFISLFPHLIAGPIQRPGHLLPQVQGERSFKPEQFYDGIMLIVSGLFRKCVIADNCALLVSAVFAGNFGKPNAVVLAIGAYAFAWQIYGDFSGYSDIARGSAQLLGFHFMINFRQPYLATSLQDFWRRWHISLSTWLRDYLYIPLGGSREKGYKTYRNLLLTMVLGGLWHGANWTFVIWGWLHGIVLAIERLLREQCPWLDRPLRSLSGTWPKRIFFFHVVCLGWIFFRAESLQSAASLLSGLGHIAWRPEYLVAFKFLGLFAFPLFLVDLYIEHTGEEYPLQYELPIVRAALACGTLALIAFFSANQANAFIYFQF
ncbi:MAG TPA: MBOAT family protein [Terriglobales bacterium]|nr:MBOAT family protein [Terriglobales bacterium]